MPTAELNTDEKYVISVNILLKPNINQPPKMSNNSLPIILVSASDSTIASKFIEELVDNELTDCEEKEEDGKVWQIINKYYRVNVQLIPLGDAQPLPAAWEPQIEAHVLYFTEAEEGDERVAELAEERATRHGARADVRLAVCAGEGAGVGGDALRAWTRRRRYELVPLQEEPDGDYDGPFADTYGLSRVRTALHAHTWRGLERVDRPAPARRALDPIGPTSSDSEYEGSDSDGADSEGAVERAEEFAAALRVLSAAGGGAGGGGAEGLAPGERRRAAERLVAAVCRALGSDLPAL